MVTSLIFDLDNTLVNTLIAQSARSRRAWAEVYSLIPLFTLYDGMSDLCKFIRENHFKTSIVSTSPKKYVEKVVRYFDLPFADIIGFHDARIKPAPDAMLMALNRMDTTNLETISFGDKRDDIIASNSAGIPSGACFWGSEEIEMLSKAPFTYRLESPQEVILLLGSLI